MPSPVCILKRKFSTIIFTLRTQIFPFSSSDASYKISCIILLKKANLNLPAKQHIRLLQNTMPPILEHQPFRAGHACSNEMHLMPYDFWESCKMEKVLLSS